MPKIISEAPKGGETKSDGAFPAIPLLDSLHSVSVPIDAPHRYWSPIQKLTQVYNEIQLADVFVQPERISRQIREQSHRLVEIFDQMRDEQRNGNNQSFQKWALFAEMCEMVAERLPEEQRGKLLVLAESAVSIATGGEASLHAPMRLYGAELALKAATLARAEHIELVDPDPTNSVALGELKILMQMVEDGTYVDPNLILKLKHILALSPAQRKFPAPSGSETGSFSRSGDVHAGYLQIAGSQLRAAVRLTKQAETGDIRILPLDRTQQEKAGQLQAALEIAQGTVIDSKQFMSLTSDLVTNGSTPEKVGWILTRMDSSTLKFFSIEELSELIGMLQIRLIAEPIVDVLWTEIISRVVSILQLSPDKVSPRDSKYRNTGRSLLLDLAAETLPNISPDTAIPNFLKIAEFELSAASATVVLKKPSKLTTLLAKRVETVVQNDHLPTAKKCIDAAISRVKDLNGNTPAERNERQRLETTIVAIYLKYCEELLAMNGTDEIQIYETASAELIGAHFSVQSLELISRHLAILQDQRKHEADQLEQNEETEAEIARLTALLNDPSKYVRFKARLDLADVFVRARRKPLEIVELLYCREFNLRGYSQDVLATIGARSEANSSDEDFPHNRSPLETQLFNLRHILAVALLEALEEMYRTARELTLSDQHKIEDWVEEAVRLHPQLVVQARETAVLLLKIPVSTE